MNTLLIRFLMLIILLSGTDAYAQSRLQAAVDAFANDPQFAQGSVSVTVLDQNTGKLLAAHQSQTVLTPASTLKLMTTATALEVLGDDFQFVTKLEYDGAIDASGTLNGNLYIKGSGDPTLGSHHFAKAENLQTVLEKWVQAVKTHGIKKINGKIVGDGSCFTGPICAPGWPWEDLGNYYGSGAWGLNLQENLYFLHLQQKTKLGAQPDILKTVPEIPNLLLLNEMTSAEKGSGDQAYIFGGPYSYTRFVRGTIPVGSGVFKVKGSIPDPGFFAAHELMLALARQGVACEGQATSQFELNRMGKATKEQRQSFFEYASPRLIDIVKEANLKSVNIYCEALLKVMGWKEKGEGSLTAGVAVIKDRLNAKGIEMEGSFLEDGSGLSPRNKVSSSQLAQFLYQVSQDEEHFGSFFKSLAIGGKTGTLRYLFKGTLGEGRVNGKSGGMNKVRSYTGYAKTVGGKKRIFAIIANNYTGKSGSVRRKMERLMIDLCKD